MLNILLFYALKFNISLRILNDFLMSNPYVSQSPCQLDMNMKTFFSAQPLADLKLNFVLQ